MVAGERLGGARAIRAPLAVAALTAAATAYVAAVDPGQPGHYPTCPFLILSGWYCPGCGGLRAVHALSRGDIGAAFGLNPLLVVMVPVLAYLWARWARSSWTGRPLTTRLLRPAIVAAFLVVAASFWVLRNLPLGQVLAP